MLAICSALEIFPASTYAGSPPTQLKRTNTSTMTPRIVGIICHTRRMMYAYIARYLRRNRFFARRLIFARRLGSLIAARVAADVAARAGTRPHIDVLPLGVEDRMLLVAPNLRL